MSFSKLLPLCVVLALAAPAAALADSWKDESGHGRDRRERGWDWRGNRQGERWDDRDRKGRGERRDDRRGHYAPPHVPYGHAPPPGEYRPWLLDLPPGHQPPPRRW